MKIEWISLENKTDYRGSLIVAEAQKNIPFEIKRMYCIYNVPDQNNRGLHAHRELQQVMLCVAGSCQVMLDNGHEKTVVILQQNGMGLLIDKMIWREMSHFSKDCVLIVLASAWYDEADYIRDYDEFKKQAML